MGTERESRRVESARPWGLVGALLAVLALAGAGCGGGGPSAALPTVTTTTIARPTTTTSGRPTTTTEPTTTTAPTTTTEPATTTEPPTSTAPTTTSASTEGSTTTVAAAPASAASSTPWGWIIALIVVVVAVVVLLLALAARNRRRTVEEWRAKATGVVDDAHLARSLLPVSGTDVPEDAHWRAVRARAEQAARSLDTLSTDAPSEEMTGVTQRAASSMRDLVFALDSDRLLREGSQPPTAEQLAEADTSIRARTLALDTALSTLDTMVKPSEPHAAGATTTGG